MRGLRGIQSCPSAVKASAEASTSTDPAGICNRRARPTKSSDLYMRACTHIHTHYTHTCIFIHIHIIYLSVCLSVYVSICLFISLSIYRLTYLPTYLPTYPLIYLFIYLRIYVPIFLYACVSACVYDRQLHLRECMPNVFCRHEQEVGTCIYMQGHNRWGYLELQGIQSSATSCPRNSRVIRQVAK